MVSTVTLTTKWLVWSTISTTLGVCTLIAFLRKTPEVMPHSAHPSTTHNSALYSTKYEDVSRSLRTGRLERELQMV
jgi:hypothetical protein